MAAFDAPAPQCQPSTEYTPTPWNCASRYSSVVGVPIINQQGKRVGNTALPDMPPEWDHMKRQAEIDAAFIVEACNSHASLRARVEELEKALRPFVDVSDQSLQQMIKIIKPGLGGLEPVALVVTKDQFLAALAALPKQEPGE